MEGGAGREGGEKGEGGGRERTLNRICRKNNHFYKDLIFRVRSAKR